MAGNIPQSFIELLLERVDLYSLINARVPLKKKGNDYWACCPFHNEKSPSFSVSATKGFYHCFGCGAHGNAIQFLRQYDNLDFVESVEVLASSIGLEVPREAGNASPQPSNKPLYALLERARDYYRQQLIAHPASRLARDYLKERGLNQAIIERFQLGFAPPEKRNFSAHCNKNEVEDLIRLRMVSDKYGAPVDLFHNRLMFPIHNRKGQVVAFGGRTLGDDKAKYINSPESDVFHKSRELFGLHEAMKANRQLDSLLVVEGYLDVIALAQFGIENAVAALGTATNTENISALLRQCKTITFCFDGDAAGRSAARKAMENALPLLEDGTLFRFLLLPEGEDPDTLVRKEGAERFRQRMDEALPLSRFFFSAYSEDLDLSLPEDKGRLKERATPQIERIKSPTIARATRSQLYELTRPDFGNKRQNARPISSPGFSASAGKRWSYKIPPGAKICLALYYAPASAETYLAQLNKFSAPAEFNPAREFCTMLIDRDITSTQQLLLHLATYTESRERFRPIFESLELVPDSEAAKAEAEGELRQISLKWLEQRIESLLRQGKTGQPLNAAQQQELKNLYQQKEEVRQKRN